MNIYQRINAVMKAVKYVQKDSTVSTGGGSYKAVSHDMVLAVLREAIVENGIVVQVQQLSGELVQQRGPNPKEDKGYTQHLYSASYQVRFVNMEQPDDFLETAIHAHAQDSGDKAPGKACSYAVKYAMLKTFGLETGEDDESRMAEPYSPEQFEIYHDLLINKKAQEFFVFVSTLPHETSAALFNSFPEGKISQGKKAVRDLQAQGQHEFENMVDEIKRRLDADDPAVLELTDPMTDTEKRLLVGRLQKHEVEQLSKIKLASL